MSHATLPIEFNRDRVGSGRPAFAGLAGLVCGLGAATLIAVAIQQASGPAWQAWQLVSFGWY